MNRISSGLQSTSQDLLKLCWKHQDCSGCLAQQQCGWCPTSSTCVPNKLGIFAPIFEDSDFVCPLWSEGWELRSRPLGCHVSTITLLTCIVSVLATFASVGTLMLIGKYVPILQARWKNRSRSWWVIWPRYETGWWRGWRLRLVDKSSERRPLLDVTRESA